MSLLKSKDIGAKTNMENKAKDLAVFVLNELSKGLGMGMKLPQGASPAEQKLWDLTHEAFSSQKVNYLINIIDFQLNFPCPSFLLTLSKNFTRFELNIIR